MSTPRTGISREASGSRPRPQVGSTQTKAPSSSSSASATSNKKTSAKDVADAFAKGQVTLGTALGVTPAQRDVMRHRAFALLNDARLDLAEPLLEGLVALDPFDAWTLVALGGLKLDKGEVALAKKLLDRAVEVAPADVTARALRAEAAAKSGEVSAAKKDLAVIADADPSLPAVRRAKALGVALKGAVDGVAVGTSAAQGSAKSERQGMAGRKSRAKLR